MNLFAITHASSDNILRLPLSADLQTNLETEFNRQEADFFNRIEELLPFCGAWKAEADEAFTIDQFSTLYDLPKAIKQPMSFPLYDKNLHNLSEIKAIFCGSSTKNNRILIQKFNKKNVIETKKYMFFFSGDTFVKSNDDAITIDDNICAAIEPDSSLVFRSYHSVRQVFDMSEYFVEATNDQMAEFANIQAFSIADQAKFLAIDNQFIRKKITEILKSGHLGTLNVQNICADAKKYKVEINIDDKGKILIPEDKQKLRVLLKFLNEDFFESIIKKDLYLSNSKRPI
ncbi:hypothetical protein ACI01nite_25210 [Acetobacter cibinongensis]|uniref:DUF4868 domain-containing protein n=1 Tax=Acetobacter cibinongensis TaxID=146475 RepID=A0A0D6N7W0_9PROT|nr:Kiwa anti-phage protein KwaB-like domain-containing protein [Acetobacter cibinongensis]GAN61586.1 hypothetical protein Abci_046_019 [Acetobacter cibinongensis]GBQ17668.1 hypothetical protein AA0482_1977 [Acetobacter cibinongensis NRIC 0482]GEL59919.1 hypothetical protein ACI01nite_25210 [Acetobacter cibinongensis]